MPLLIGLLLLLALIPFALYRGSQVTEAEAAWWNESWQYRQSIAVTNNTTEQTNVYIAVSLDTSNTSKFQADCGDLRFTKQNGQLLPYYIVSGCGTASTSVHIQLDAFPAGAQTFYAYYGNLSADNGFLSSDFLLEATSHTIGGIGSEETGPGPVAYWRFDEGSGSTAFDSASYGLGDELLTDGDMEAADTSAWTEENSAVLSKETTSPHGGSRVLRITNGSTVTGQTRQAILETGKRYRVRGFARSVDGTGFPAIRPETTTVWTGTTSIEWQEFDVEFLAGGTNFRMRNQSSSSGTAVEFDDVTVKAVSSGNHGAITGATWANEDQCVSGKCLSFDGGDYVSVADHSNLKPASAITLSAWIYPTNPRYSYQMIIDKQSAFGSYGYTLRLDSSTGKIKFRADGTSSYDLLSNTVLSANTWYHVQGIYDGTTLKIFINGREDASKASTGNISYDSSDLQIGRRIDGFYFQGRIDEPKIFPYALTEDQIKAEYNLGAAAVMGTGPTVAPPESGTLSDSLVAHWAFDEQYGQTAHDKVGNNHGTFGASTSPGSDDPTWTAVGECKVNGCLEFDGGDHLSLSTFVDNSNSHTFAMWVRSSAAISGTRFLFDIATARTVIAWHQIPGKLSFYTSGWHDSTLDPPNDGQWHHLAYVLDGTTSKGAIYIDGELGQENIPYSPTTFNGAAAIGAHNAAVNYWFTGHLDEFKIYNTALTADQVRQDMNAGASVAYSVGSEEADELADGAGAPPVAEWKFDEKQGTVAYDSSGNANDGTVNGATWKSGCQQGACLEFDGVDDYVSGFSSGYMTAFTAQAWVKTSLGSLQNVFYGGDAGTYISIGSNRAAWYDGSSWRYGSTTVSDNQWHHLVYVFNNGAHYIWVDGRLEYNNNAGNGTYTRGAINKIGARNSDRYFNGQIDHVKIYDYARTPAQIAYDYNRGAPVAHWKFDECEGTVAHDASGNENHGTITIGASGSQTTAGTCSTSGAWANGASGKFEGSLKFDGVDDYTVIPDNNTLQLTSALTVSAWAKDLSERGPLVLKGSNYVSRSYNFRLGAYTSSNKLEVGVSSASSEYYAQPAYSNFDGWHMYTIVADGNYLNTYVDGVLVNTRSAPGPYDGFAGSSAYIGIVGGYRLGGQIDDVRIYNYALSPSQIQKVYNQGYGVRYGPETGNQ